MEIKINTKYDTGEEVYFLWKENIVKKGHILNCSIKTNYCGESKKCYHETTYTITNNNLNENNYTVREEDICRTKEEMNNYIFNKIIKYE